MFLRFCPAGRNVGRSAYPLRFASVVGLSAPLDRPSPFALSLSGLKTLADCLVVNSESEAETGVVVVRAVSAVVAIGYARVPTVVAPATTTKNAVPTLRRSGWIGLRITLIVSIPIVAPLPYVATHIIQAELVGFLGLDRVGLAVVLDNPLMCVPVPFS